MESGGQVPGMSVGALPRGNDTATGMQQKILVWISLLHLLEMCFCITQVAKYSAS